jgi:myo-inosose-2 dehydratase
MARLFHWRARSAPEKMMTIRIGANPIGWSNDDLKEIGGDTPLEVCLAEARQAGVEGMEKGHKLPDDGALLKAKLAEYGLVFVGGWWSAALLRRSAREEFEAAKAHVAMTKAAGAEVMIAAECSNAIHGDRARPLSTRPKLAKDERKAFGARMTEFANRVADAGLRLCYHPHMGAVAQTADEIDAFLEATRPPVELLLDTGHATWGGADPAALARLYRERIGHVHCKDVREAKMREANAKDLSFLDAIVGVGDELGVFTVPGDGMVEFAAVFRELKGYSGWIVLEAEQDPKKAPALPYAERGVAHLRSALSEAGLG